MQNIKRYVVWICMMGLVVSSISFVGCGKEPQMAESQVERAQVGESQEEESQVETGTEIESEIDTDTEKNSDIETDAESERESKTGEPSESESPESSEEPEVSEKPELSEEPESSEIPESSEEPEVSEDPKTTEQPIEQNTPSTFLQCSIKTTDIEEFRYWLYTPENPTADMPLIVYLHGGSGKGDDLTLITAVDGFPKYLQDGVLGEIPAYVVIPQVPSNLKGWVNVKTSVLSLIVYMKNAYQVDENNISLTGHSMGGTGTWNLALAYPETFARIAPLSGSIRTNEVNLQKLQNLPIRTYVGADDKIVAPESTLEFVAELEKTNSKATVTLLPETDHFEVPAAVYLSEDIGIIDWLLGNET